MSSAFSSLPLDPLHERNGAAEDAAAERRQALKSFRFHVSRYESAEFLPTGIEDLDRLLKGGIPRGKLIEITGDLSSGKTSLLLSILAQATAGEEFIAYIDAFDALDPEGAADLGIDLKRLLWVRCGPSAGAGGADAAVNKALQAADILTQAGGFGLIALDLQAPPPQRGVRVPLHIWFRLQRAVKGSLTTMLVVARSRTVGSAASLVLALERQDSCWSHRSSRSANVRFRVDAPAVTGGMDPIAAPEKVAGNRFQGLQSRAHLLRGEVHGSIPVYCRF
jgi:recombination protein RecA